MIAAIGLYTDRHGHDLAQAQAGALLPYPDRAGAASSLLGFVTQTSSAVVGAILGHTLGLTRVAARHRDGDGGRPVAAVVDAEPRRARAAADLAPAEQPVDQPVVDAAVG